MDIEILAQQLADLRSEFDEFKAYAKPVIDGHQTEPAPPPPPILPPLTPPRPRMAHNNGENL
jgi:hypothetical protein